MSDTVGYARYELVRTFRNRRLFIFSLGFPLVLYYAIAGPNRQNHDFAAAPGSQRRSTSWSRSRPSER